MHERTDLRDAQSRSTLAFGRKERFEDSLRDLLGYSRTVVLYTDANVHAHLPLPARLWPDLTSRRADPDFTAARHGVPGIDHQVQDCGRKLRLVHAAFRKPRAKIENDANRRSGSVLQERF